MSSPTLQRAFLGWDSPFLESASKWLLARAKTDSHIDLSGLTILSSVSRASRHLTELLLFEAERRDIGMSPPEFVSISSLFKHVSPELNIVNSTDSMLIFNSILKSCDQDLLLNLFPSLKTPGDLKLFDKASLLASCYQEFTKNGDRASASIERLISTGLVPNEERFLALSRIFDLYEAYLKDAGLQDPQSCLLTYETTSCIHKGELILLACYDFAPIIKRTLKVTCSKITSLIFAPEQEKEGFDELGCIIPDYWRSRTFAFDPAQVQICNSSEGQARQIFFDLGKIQYSPGADQITIGALEPGMNKLIEIIGNHLKLPIHVAGRTSLLNSEAAQLISFALRYTESRSFSDLSALLAIHSFSGPLPLAGKSLTAVNQYREEKLQPFVLAQLPDCPPEIVATITKVDEILKIVSIGNSTLIAWVEACICLFDLIYGEQKSPEVEQVIAGLESLLTTQAEEVLSPLTFSKLIETALSEIDLSTEDLLSASEIPSPDSIDVVGWLELALDNAPYTFLSGLNEGFAPLASSPNAFLPDKAKKLLGLEDNDYRLARDSYVFETFLNSKKHLRIYASRNSLDGSPLLPSRLLLKGGAQKIASTIEYFFTSKAPNIPQRFRNSTTTFQDIYSKSLLPKDSSPLAPPRISVTAIGAYLQCPYLYFLRHVLKIRRTDPESRELSALQFGNLLHDLISDFSNSEQSKDSSEKKIESFLLHELEGRFKRLFGNSPFPEVLVQYHQIESRLKTYARWHAGWVAEGWRVWKVESPFENPGYRIETGSGQVHLSGRIDRIDVNEKSGEYAIIDFKSGDRSATPANAFSKTRGWLDVQLPCYFFYAQESLGLGAPMLGILPISASADNLSPNWAKWDEAQLASAKDAVKSAVEGIIQQKFWPPKLAPEKSYDFEAIYRAHL